MRQQTKMDAAYLLGGLFLIIAVWAGIAGGMMLLGAMGLID